VWASKPLIDRFEEEVEQGLSVEIQAVYQWKPRQCLACNVFAHSKRQCPLSAKEQPDPKEPLNAIEKGKMWRLLMRLPYKLPQHDRVVTSFVKKIPIFIDMYKRRMREKGLSFMQEELASSSE